MTSSVFKTFVLDAILPKTLKVFEIQYRRHDETTDAKLKHGSVTDCSGCHGNTTFRVIWILGVFPVKFPQKKKKKERPASLIRLDWIWIFPCRSPHVCLSVQERLYLQSHDLFITANSQNNTDNVAEPGALLGVHLCVKTFNLRLRCYIFGCFECQHC